MIGHRAEHGVCVRRVAVDVRHQHEHVVRLQRRVVGERGENLIANDLELALRRMAIVDAQRVLVGAEAEA